MEFIGFAFVLALLFGVVRCSDKTHLELNIARLQKFEMNGREYFCKNTDKQLQIDKINNELVKIKAQ